MVMYALVETCGNAGCYGIFSTVEKATEAALTYIKEWEYDNAEETVWDGWQKHLYYGCVEDGNAGCFEITRHNVDAE